MKKLFYKWEKFFKMLAVIIVIIIFSVMPLFIIISKDKPEVIKPNIKDPEFTTKDITYTNGRFEDEKYYSDVSFKIDDSRFNGWEPYDYVVYLTDNPEGENRDKPLVDSDGHYIGWTKKQNYSSHSVLLQSAFGRWFRSQIELSPENEEEFIEVANDLDVLDETLTQEIAGLQEGDYYLKGQMYFEYNDERTDSSSVSSNTISISKPISEDVAEIQTYTNIESKNLDSASLSDSFKKSDSESSETPELKTDVYYTTKENIKYIYNNFDAPDSIRMSNLDSTIYPRLQFRNLTVLNQCGIDIFSQKPTLTEVDIDFGLKNEAGGFDKQGTIYHGENIGVGLSSGSSYVFDLPAQHIYDNSSSFYNENSLIADPTFEYQFSGKVEATFKSKNEIISEIEEGGIYKETKFYEDDVDTTTTESKTLLEDQEHKFEFNYKTKSGESLNVDTEVNDKIKILEPYSNIINYFLAIEVYRTLKLAIYMHWDGSKFVIDNYLNFGSNPDIETFNKLYYLGNEVDMFDSNNSSFPIYGSSDYIRPIDVLGNTYFNFKTQGVINLNPSNNFILKNSKFRLVTRISSKYYSFSGSRAYYLFDDDANYSEFINLSELDGTNEEIVATITNKMESQPGVYTVLPQNIRLNHEDHTFDKQSFIYMVLITTLVMFIIPILLMTIWVIIKKTTRW